MFFGGGGEGAHRLMSNIDDRGRTSHSHLCAQSLVHTDITRKKKNTQDTGKRFTHTQASNRTQARTGTSRCMYECQVSSDMTHIDMTHIRDMTHMQALAQADACVFQVSSLIRYVYRIA